MTDEIQPNGDESHRATVRKPSGVPLDATDLGRRRAAIDRLKEFRKGRVLGVPVNELIDEGRTRLVRKFLG